MVVARLALAITALLALSGCVVSEDDVEAAANEAAEHLENADFGSASANQAARDSASVLRALSNVSTNVTGLNVTVSFSADGNGTLTYDVAFGDNSSENGTMDVRAVEVDENVTPTGNYSYVVTLSHAYAGPGLYNITVAVTAGEVSLERTVSVTVAESGPVFGPTQDPILLEGTVACAPTIVLDGEIAGETHLVAVNEGQRAFTLTLAYDELLVEDLDFVLTSPSGKEYASEAAGAEPPLDIETPEAGEWTLTIIGYSCMGEQDYTVDILFA